ncbi:MULTISPECIES: hypothetical protein [Amycolatopsis]|uniref:Secreted protein n=1 Tax=Amycolatopsis thermalba TaxID=944492 RepID=A0ABY4P3E3_9PSEU|nr:MULTISPECIES: hypothetical protein [Amycolatopsis]OXM71434.1 hypothetical protein CF166_19395 [Amycolatopsis sp. KNN50.9b]UQS26876.1 hypothetical protein L1857_30790 [Amycolatopsis thermalba]
MPTRTKAALCAVALAGLALATPQATAATYPTNPFNVSYGATYAAGTMTWYARAVRLDGNLRSLSSSGCRRAYAVAYTADLAQLDERSTSAQCGDQIKPFQIDLTADVAGGAAIVSVCLLDGGGAPLGECKAYARSDAS